MKKQFSLLIATLLAISGLLVPGAVQGQTAARLGPKGLFRHLDRTRIPGGLLWPRPALDTVASYNGRMDSIANWRIREQFVSSLQRAAFDSVPGLARLPKLRERYSTTATVPLALLDYRYGAIKPWAIDSALLVIHQSDSLYYDGPNRRESPYLAQRLFVLAPLRGVSYQATVSFQLDADALLTNHSETLTQLAFDGGDGLGWRPLVPGVPVHLTYTTVGPKTLRLRARSSIGEILLAAASYYVARIQTMTPDLTGTLNSAGLPAQPLPGCYDVGQHGPYAQAYWYARLGAQNTSGQIRRPIIFVEGIDFGKELNYTDDPLNHGEFGWNMFVNGGGINQQGQPDYQQLAEMPLLLQYLHDKGYDVILLDFEWGADLIQKNAMTLVALLNTLQQRGLDEPATVVGTSMGGLVSRYALAWMEQHHYPHCARLWVSFDSPQNVDANVPLGLQHMINFWADNLGVAEAESGQRRVRSPAAAQMLVYQAWDQSDCYRSQFASLLNGVGLNSDHMPERLRRVAILNGSKLAHGQGFNPGDEILHYEWSCPGIINHVFRSNVWAVPDSPGSPSGQDVFNGRALNVLSPWNLSCVPALLGATAMPLLGRAACLVALNTNGPYFRAHVSPSFPTEPYDGAPGGWGPFMKGQAGNQYLPDPFGWVQIGKIQAVHDNACFIPITSSLALRNYTPPGVTSRLFYNIGSNSTQLDPDHPNPLLTPFQAFYAPDENQQHTRLTAENRAFALAQLSGNGNGNRLGGDRPVNLASWVPSLPYSATSDGAFINVSIFNFGEQSFERQLYSVAVNAGGLLHVNQQNLMIDAGQNPNVNIYPSPGTFEIHTSDCGATVTVNQGGLFELGTAGATQHTGYRAIAHFEQGSVLDIEAGLVKLNEYSEIRMKAGSLLKLNGKLVVGGHARVVVEPGARLEVLPGSQIELNTLTAVLDLAGEVVVKSGATLTFTRSAQAAAAGYIRFALPDNRGAGNIDLEDATARIVLQGTGPDDVVAAIAGGSYVKLQEWRGNDFFVENGRVTMGTDAWLDFSASNTRIVNAVFQGSQPGGDGYRTVYVWNRPGQDIIENSRFENAQTGLTAVLNGPGARAANIYLHKVDFTNCQRGLHTIEGGANLLLCHFDNTNCQGCVTQSGPPVVGWLADAATQSSRAERCVFKGYAQGKGINYYTTPGLQLLLKESLVSENEAGVAFTGAGTLRGECGAVFRNETGIEVGQGATLDLSNKSQLSIVNNGRGQGAGAWSYNIVLDNAAGLVLAGGNNDLIGRNNETSGISGQLIFPTPPAAPLDANYNHWNVYNGHPRIGAGDVAINAAYPGGTIFNYGVQTPQLAGSPYCYVDPCEVPLRPGLAPTDCWSQGGFRLCQTCEPITTPYVTADSLHHALLLAISYRKKYDPNSSDLLALQMLRAVLRTPLADTTAEEAVMLEKGYAAMKEIYAASLADSTNPDAPAIRALMEDIINHKLAAVPPADSSIYNPEFYLLMDRALTAYAAQGLPEARQSLDEAAALNNPLTQAYWEYWDCFLHTTQQWRDHQLTDDEYVTQLGTCGKSRTAGRGQQAEAPAAFLARMRAREEARAARQAHRSALSLAPNPTNGQLTVTLAVPSTGPVMLEVRTLAGQPLRHWERTFTAGAMPAWELNLADLPAGVYLVRAQTAERTYTQRLVVKP